MDDSIYDNLPDDHELAFTALEAHYKSSLEKNVAGTDDSNVTIYYHQKYCIEVIAAAKSLGIEYIKDYTIPEGSSLFWRFKNQFEAAVTSLIIQIRINHSRRRKTYSVYFDISAKQKIRHYIEQIRTIIEHSDLTQNKRDSILRKLSDLTYEIDRDRTRFEVVADSLRSFARLSGDLEREGAEPWWKWFKLILGEIDEAKEKEPQISLPSPHERKRLEPPRNNPTNERRDSSNQSSDDEIPF